MDWTDACVIGNNGYVDVGHINESDPTELGLCFLIVTVSIKICGVAYTLCNDRWW